MDEEGTEAAAATAVIMDLTSAPVRGHRTVDRPAVPVLAVRPGHRRDPVPGPGAQPGRLSVRCEGRPARTAPPPGGETMRRLLLLGLAAALLAAACGDGEEAGETTTTLAPRSRDHRSRCPRPPVPPKSRRSWPPTWRVRAAAASAEDVAAVAAGDAAFGADLLAILGEGERRQPGGVAAEHPPRPGHGLRRGPRRDRRPDGRGAALRPARRHPPRRLQLPRPGPGGA